MRKDHDHLDDDNYLSSIDRIVSRISLGRARYDYIVHFHRCVTKEGQVTVMNSNGAPMYGPMTRDNRLCLRHLPFPARDLLSS